MAEEEKTPENEETPEITLESVDEFDADNLSDEQKTFIEENKDQLTPEQAEKFGISKEEEKEEEEEFDDKDLEPETRRVKKAEDEKKDEDEGGDDDIDPEDEKSIGKVVDKKLKAVEDRLQRVQHLEDQAEVDAVIRDNPMLGKYRSAALKYMAHPSYKDVPAINIMAIVSSKDAQKIGAQKEREASKRVKETQGNGSQARKQTGGKPDWANMSKEEFEAEKARVMQQR